MQCPKCSSRNHRAPVTNSQFEDQTVRKRVCPDCGHVWFTVELNVPNHAIGWSPAHQNKPVVRAAIELSPSFIEAQDTRANIAKAHIARWKKYVEKYEDL